MDPGRRGRAGRGRGLSRDSPRPGPDGRRPPPAWGQPLRPELILLGISLAAWALALLALFGLLSLAGSLPLDLYGFYSLAAAVGWVAGNVYVQRSRDRPRPLRRRMLLSYLFGPPGLLFLARVMAPAAAQAAAPLVPTYGFGVFAIFFLVPVTLKGAFRG